MSKSFGAFRALQGVNLTLNKGEFGAVIGSSGCGKSTLLKIMDGELLPLVAQMPEEVLQPSASKPAAAAQLLAALWAADTPLTCCC